MRIILSLIGIVGSFFLVRFREQIGNILGEAEWMNKVGGVYNVVVLIAIILFFWSLAELTGTTSLLFAPLRFFIPGIGVQQQQEFVPVQDF